MTRYSDWKTYNHGHFGITPNYPWYKKLWLRLMGAESCNKK